MTLTSPRSLAGRLILLLACIGLGTAIGVVGYRFTGDQRWFLAIPVLLALVWLFVADPEQCMGRCDRK